MKFWTVQKKLVLKEIFNLGKYEPDFNKSDGIGSHNMHLIYCDLLETYKNKNKVDSKGLVFGISKLDDRIITDIKQYNNYFYENPLFSDSASYYGEDYVLLELNVDDSIDTIPIFFQDFTILAYRHLQDDGYLNYIKPKLKEVAYGSFESDLEIAQSIGWIDDYIDVFGEKLLYNIIQAHVHQIRLDDIIGIYPTSDYNNKVTYSLCNEAKIIQEYIDNKKL